MWFSFWIVVRFLTKLPSKIKTSFLPYRSRGNSKCSVSIRNLRLKMGFSFVLWTELELGWLISTFIHTLSRNCHVLNLSIFVFVPALDCIMLLTSTVLYMLQEFSWRKKNMQSRNNYCSICAFLTCTVILILLIQKVTIATASMIFHLLIF